MKKNKIGIINCEFGNIASLINAIKYLNYDYEILNKPKKQKNLTHLILPGVGSFNEAAKKLRRLGWFEEIKNFIGEAKPFMGICLRMQLMFESGSENGDEKGLGLFSGKCHQFQKDLNINIPHIGFNLVNYAESKIWKNIPNNSPFYFVHSYYAKVENKKNIVGTYKFGDQEIPSIVSEKNIIGCQFHPEKSGTYGLKLIKNFISI